MKWTQHNLKRVIISKFNAPQLYVPLYMELHCGKLCLSLETNKVAFYPYAIYELTNGRCCNECGDMLYVYNLKKIVTEG